MFYIYIHWIYVFMSMFLCFLCVCTTCSGGSPVLALCFLCAFDTLNGWRRSVVAG